VFRKSKGLIVVLLSALVLLTAINPVCFAEAQHTGQSSLERSIKDGQWTQSEVQQKLNTLSVPFVENKGQVKDKEVKYIADTIIGKAYVTDAGIEYAIAGREGITFIQEKFNGGNSVQAKGINEAKAKINYFKGKDQSQWLRDIPSYNEITYSQVYDNITVNLRAYGKNIEKLFKINPGGDPRDIEIEVIGSAGLYMNEQGELEIKLEDGKVKMTKPIAYQQKGEKRQEIPVDYILNGNKYGFKVGEYDPTLPLIIDPFIASTY
jgi:hypothetical protein